MATTPVVPSTPAAAAAPAAAPPQATPSVAPPSPAPAAPPTTVAPAAGAPPSTTPTGPQPPAKLNPSEFGNAVDSYQAEVTWRQQLEAFKAENPGVEITDDSPWPTEAKPADAAPAADAAPPAEAAKTEAEKPAETPAAEGDESYSLAEETPLTPQSLNELFKGDAALQAAIEANPAAKGALFKMAREHAELAPLKGIFPGGAESAKFARDTAARTTSLRMQFQGAETPEAIGTAYENFAQEFAVMGADGKQAVDEGGNPIYGDDFYMLNEHIVNRYTDSTLEDVEARIKENKYASDAERERDNDLRLALSIIKDDLNPKDGGKKKDPDLSHLPEETRKEVQARLDEAKAIEAKNDATKAGAGKQSREAIRTEGTKKFYSDAGTRTFQQVDKIVEGLRKAGAVIPDWQLKATLPGSNVSAFNNAVGMAIETAMKADPFEQSKQFQLELQYLSNPTPENHQARIAAFDSFLQTKDHTGKSLINRTVTDLVRKHGADVKGAADARTIDTPPAASKEPAQGGPARPHAMTSDEAWKAAETQLAKEVKDWHSLNSSERMTQIFARQRTLLGAAR